MLYVHAAACATIWIDGCLPFVVACFFFPCLCQVEALQTYYGVRVSVASSGRMYVLGKWLCLLARV